MKRKTSAESLKESVFALFLRENQGWPARKGLKNRI